MSFLESYDLATDPEFVSRVEIALAKSAVAVSSEDPTTAHHDTRAAYSKRVLDAPASAAASAAIAVVTNAAITATSPDDAIEFTLNSMWNALAGVITTPTP